MQSPALFALGAAFVLGFASPLTVRASSQEKNPGVVLALERDLASIPPGASPTNAQTQALAADLGRIYRAANSPPTITLNDVAARLANAAAQGQFLAGDLQILAVKVTSIAAGSSLYDNVKVAALEETLSKVGIAPADAQGLAAGVRALPYSKQSYIVGDTRLAILQPNDSSVRGYKHAGGDVQLDTTIGPIISQGVVTDPYFLSQGITVELTQVPLGKYHVSVTTGSNAQPVELGLIRVRPGSLILTYPTSGNAEFGHARSGRASFENFSSGQTLPASVSVDDITTVTVADEQGIPRLTVDLTTAAASSKLTLDHSAQGHLTATAAAPTAGGSVSVSIFDNASAQDGVLLFTAVGLPANAALTFSVNGAAVGPVTTGPTGDLYVKTKQGVFPRPPKSTEVINVLPDTVDLFTATAFAVSDAQGSVLLSSTPEN